MVELLVVVAVILILTTIGIPTSRYIKEGARKSECIGKLRQLYVGQFGYSMDWNGFILPTSATDPANNQYRSYWNSGMMNSYLDKKSTSNYTEMSNDVYGCRKAREQHSIVAAKQTYGQNDNITEFKWRLGGMATPNSTVFIGDGAFVNRISGPAWFEMIADMSSTWDPYNPINSADDDRFPDGPHDGSQVSKDNYSLDKSNKGNFVFMDGHAETRLWGKIPSHYTSTFWKLR